MPEAFPKPAVETPAARPPSDPFADELRGFGLPGIVAMVVIVLAGGVPVGAVAILPVGAVLALAWVVRSRTLWREVGYVRPRSWLLTVTLGIGVGVALKLLMKTLVMPLLGAPPINPAYHFLAGNQALLPAAVLGMLTAGFAEETVFRGYLFERARRLLGSGTRARVWTVLITSAVFGLGHYSNQGLAGVEQGAITGLVFGTMFAVTGEIWLPMIAHAVFDLTALAIIYANLESRFAHMLFK